MDPYEELANAIVLQSVKDYRMTDDEKELEEIARFFRSGWFGVLTKVDSDLLIKQLRKEKAQYDYESISGLGEVSGHAHQVKDTADRLST